MSLCRKKLHDLGNPANLYKRPNSGKAQCKPCLKAAHSKRSRERRLGDSEFRLRENARSERWAKENKSHLQEYRAAYFDANRERYNAHTRAAYRRRREKKLEYAARWREQNRDHMRELVSEWALRNPDRRADAARRRRARKRNALSDGHYREEVLARWGRNCWMCGLPLFTDWHEDHVVPLVRGGADTLDNCRPSCPSCNLRKGVKLLAA